MSTSSVSVVIPVYNGEKYLAEAIESALHQTVPPAQVIVVDDGSVDGSAALARSFGECVTVLSQANGGIGDARNTGMAIATGAFLAFLDADDYWSANKTALQLAAFDDDPSLDCVFGGMRPFLREDAPDSVREAAVLADLPGVVAGAMLIRRSAFDSVGPFSTAVLIGEFVDWFERARTAGLRHSSVDSVVLHRGIHANNTGLRERANRSDYLTVVRQALERRRAAANDV